MATYIDHKGKVVPEEDPPRCLSTTCRGKLTPIPYSRGFCTYVLCNSRVAWECTKCDWWLCEEHVA